jgi:hypothetical protein
MVSDPYPYNRTEETCGKGGASVFCQSANLHIVCEPAWNNCTDSLVDLVMLQKPKFQSYTISQGAVYSGLCIG